jgi:hypothetical protein
MFNDERRHIINRPIKLNPHILVRPGEGFKTVVFETVRGEHRVDMKGLQQIQRTIIKIQKTLEQPQTHPWPWFQRADTKEDLEFVEEEDMDNIDEFDKKLFLDGARSKGWKIVKDKDGYWFWDDKSFRKKGI